MLLTTPKSRRSLLIGQAGFSLVELIVAGTLMVGMLLAGGVFMYSGDNSKAGNLLAITTELGNAAARYNADTGLHPKYPSALFVKSYNTTTYTMEAQDATDAWRGPYISGLSSSSSATGDYPLTNHVSGATATFQTRTTDLPSGAVEGHKVRVGPLPQRVFLALLNACNGTSITSYSSAPTNHANGQKCINQSYATATNTGYVEYLYQVY